MIFENIHPLTIDKTFLARFYEIDNINYQKNDVLHKNVVHAFLLFV
ncbi:hypothetical protein RV09_GL001882 [Enterococcus moraviensis]|nr:hypothetical protein RV09_GL001882 [Enterococcus moraviensis]